METGDALSGLVVRPVGAKTMAAALATPNAKGASLAPLSDTDEFLPERPASGPAASSAPPAGPVKPNKDTSVAAVPEQERDVLQRLYDALVNKNAGQPGKK